jgi:hypothetical protein
VGYDTCESVEKGHGRIETRGGVWVTRDVDWLRQRAQWPGLRGAVCVRSWREDLSTGKRSTQRRLFTTSLDPRDPGQDAAFFAGTIIAADA